MRVASEALRNGELVCIFPEGEITRIGQMLSFHRGFERIVKGIDVPIIPVYLDGIWGSIFSFSERPLPLEMASQQPASRADYLRQAAGFHRNGAGSAPGSASIWK